MPESEFAACTIVSKNYLSYARVLTESFRRHHPAARMFVLLVDRLDGFFAPEREPFELVQLADLGIPDLPRFCFQYTILELNTAAKPYFLRFLLRDRGVSKLLYLDPDIVVFRELAALRDLLDSVSFLLTPHLTELLPDDGRRPSERDILEAGTYNLGFLGLRADATVSRFLDWWAAQLYDKCIVAPANGLFVDQRWIDLIPGLFEGVQVVRDPGYNVAYWNLPHRRLEGEGENLRVNGQPLYFFHFSGVDFDRLEGVSQHQDRLSLGDRLDVKPLFEDYRMRHLAAGWSEARRWPYAFATFDNGTPILPVVRRLYLKLGDGASRFGNPFQTAHRGSFWHWLTRWAVEEVEPGLGITRLWYEVFLSRPDLQKAWPDVFGADRARFLEWTRHSGRLEHGIPPELDPEDGAARRTVGAESDPTPFSPSAGFDGVNVAGYARSEKGVGEALRATVRAFRAAGIPHAVVDVVDPDSANIDTTLEGVIAHDNPHPINLIHVNADALPHFVERQGAAFLQGKYNIGFWMWELPELPAVYHGSFSYLDEVWVGSSYCLEAISRVSPLPVVRIPLALPVDGLRTKGVDRSYFGLPDGPSIFLFVFDVHSVLARKNPTGLIEAFKRAFPKGEDVKLVLKMVHGDPDIRRALLDQADDPRVLLIDRVLDRSELNSLIEMSDCYVSLHRSEGFGVTMAEAMAIGKPVIATGYSANLDFMTSGNSFLVRYELVRLERDHGPYPAGSSWAEPDLEHAAELMRLVYEAPEQARAVALRGERDIWHYLSPASVGERIRRRLNVILEQRGRPETARRRRAVPPAGGLGPAHALPAVFEAAPTSARFLVGPAIGLLKRTVARAIRWYVGPQVAAIQARLSAVRDYVAGVREEQAARLRRVESESGELRAHIGAAEGRLSQAQVRVEARLADLHRHLTDADEGRLSQAQVRVEARLADLHRHLTDAERRLTRAEHQMFRPPYTNPEFAVGPAGRVAERFDYAGFQQKFRGPSRLIRELLAFYAPLFAGRRAVVDLGSGRGEFLEVLREHGGSGSGVEIDPDQAAECREKGLSVVVADLFDHLESLADDTLDGVFCAQVVEHLPFPRVERLFRLCHRKLEPGGVLVVETVNPHCLTALKLFHLDPTHLAPLFPETLQFLAESLGFKNVRIVYPSRSGEVSDPYYDTGEFALVAER